MAHVKLAAVLAVTLLTVSALAGYGVDVSQPTSKSAFECMKGLGFTSVIPRAYRSLGSVDPNVVATLNNAQAAGMKHLDVYLFPCPTCSKTARQQMQEAINHLRSYNAPFRTAWIDIEGKEYWMSQSENRKFINEMIIALEELNVPIGVYTNYYQWQEIVGLDFTAGAQYPLWYAHYDHLPNFSDFVPFGGWTKPAMKQYAGDVVECGAGIDKNWWANDGDVWPPITPPGEPCTAHGLAGTCVDTGKCNGESYPGFCPGASNIQCCVPTASCVTASGASGQCRSTGACAEMLGTSYPGYCSGDSTIQCCVPPSSCQAHGLSGLCVKTSTCSAQGGVSYAGFCPGDSSIQCCIEPVPTCAVGSKTGQCITTSLCSAQGGQSTPGYCPGSSAIQCCTSKRMLQWAGRP